MSDIVLSAGVRSNLLQLQQTSDLMTRTQTRLATGKRVNSALDNAINFFTAQGLDNRANDLSGLLDSMSNAINTIQAANNGLSAITKLVQSAQSLVSQARQTSDTAAQNTLATQFDALLVQIGQLAGDSGFNGINLLGGDSLTVNFNEETWLSDNGAFHTKDLKVIERLRRVGDTVQYEATAYDPAVLAEPWKERTQTLWLTDREIEESPRCEDRDLDLIKDGSHHDNPR